MSRKTFLSFVAAVALAIGTFALFFPAALLASKGVAPSAAAEVWVREVGIAILALGVVTLLVRGEPDSPALRAFLLGNLVLQLGLFPIELVAYREGIITTASGVVPNSLLHVLLAIGFAVFALRMPQSPPKYTSS